MATTKIYDDEGAYRLLEAVFQRARRDITRPIARPEDKASAYQLFQTVAMVEGEREGVPNIPYRTRGGDRIVA